MEKLINNNYALKTGEVVKIKKTISSEQIKALQKIADHRLRKRESRPIYITKESILGSTIEERLKNAGVISIIKKSEGLIRTLLGSSCLAIESKILLRRTWPMTEKESRELAHNASNLTWHQDSNARHNDKKMLVIMTNLQDGFGSIRPGLKILRNEVKSFCGVYGYEGEKVDLFETNMSDRSGKLLTIEPQLNAGETLIFDGLTFHRTNANERMTQPRDALLIRLIRSEDKSNFPDGKHCMLKFKN